MSDRPVPGRRPAPFGALLSEHRPRRTRVWLWAALAVAGSLGASIGAVSGAISGYFAYTQFGPAVVGRWAAPWLILAAACAPLAALGLINVWRLGGLVVRAYEHGLVLRHGASRRAARWEQVRGVQTAAIRYRLPGAGGPRTRLTLTLAGVGQTEIVTLTESLEGLDELAEVTKRRVYPRLLAEYTEAFNRGEELDFGPLQISAAGLSLGRRALAWNELDGATVQDGEVRLQRAGSRRRLKLPAQRIPNVELCVQLIEVLNQQP
jgi:hypothetical protein